MQSMESMPRHLCVLCTHLFAHMLLLQHCLYQLTSTLHLLAPAAGSNVWLDTACSASIKLHVNYGNLVCRQSSANGIVAYPETGVAAPTAPQNMQAPQQQGGIYPAVNKY